MEAIVEMKPERIKQLEGVQKELIAKLQGTGRGDWFNNYRRSTGYAHYHFQGYITDELISRLGRVPTADEIIILVDDGFNHFGAYCKIAGKFFSGTVNTD